ncbi:MAG: hflK [Gammaproteobacteria bacterium]|nr:hflK [Gammaproteobacteria bacterium]
MAWNQPGNQKNNDPWGKKPANGNDTADIDKLLKDIQDKLRRVFGKAKPKGSGQAPDSGNGLPWGWIIGVVAVLWILSGFYIVKPAEKAVVLRMGKYIKTVGDGPHWAPRLIDRVYKVDEQHVFSYSYNADMLTKDENIVNVDIAIQYRISDARNFLFNVVDPVATLQESTASALRQVIGNTTLDQVLTSGREDVRAGVQEQLSYILKSYGVGMQVVDVALQPAKPPEEVKDAFDNAIKAEQEREQIVNQARGYQEKVIPEALGQAQRLLASAKAYKEQVVLNAQGETARFLAMLPEYRRSPGVMRERLYLGTVESVLSNTSKLFIDVNKGNQLFLNVPIDKMLGDSGEVDNPVDGAVSNEDKQNANLAAAAASTANNSSDSYLDSSASGNTYLSSSDGSQ